MSFTMDEVPEEVQMVWNLQALKIPVGKMMYDHCQEIANKYPEWFSDDPNEELPRTLNKETNHD